MGKRVHHGDRSRVWHPFIIESQMMKVVKIMKAPNNIRPRETGAANEVLDRRRSAFFQHKPKNFESDLSVNAIHGLNRGRGRV